MAREPKKEGSRSKKRSKKGLHRRRAASRSAPRRARKSAAKVAKAARVAKPVKVAKKAKADRGTASALKLQLKEARARQAATAEILKIIASSPSDVKPVFNAIVRTVLRVMRCDRAFIMRCEGGFYVPVARATLDGSFVELKSGAQPIDPAVNFPSRAIVTKKTLYYPDRSLVELPEYEKFITAEFGVKSSVFLPLLREKECIGVLALASKSINAFSPGDIALAESFRDQAVVAIENARLFNEAREALARQTATSEVLQVISSSPGDLKPVFDQMLAKAMRLCEAQCGFIYQGEQGAMRAVAEIGVPRAFAEYRRKHLHTGGAATPIDAMRATRKPAHVHDARDSEPYRSGNPNAVAGVDLGGARTVLYVPMIRNDEIVGVINLYRLEVKPFTDEQIALLENFASQAVIAIENARLFNETRESLERQTATADILKVIASSPDDVQPVFEAIAESARRVVGAWSATVTRVVGDEIHLAAFTTTSQVGRDMLMSRYPQSFASPSVSAQVIRSGKVIMYADTEREGDETTREVGRARGFRSVLGVPMLRDHTVIGAINVTRAEPGIFDDNTVALMRTFADQAVIAIENARLFNETREALARQTATADVLKVIASSPSNLQPVFDAIAERSKALIGAHATTVTRYVDGILELAAFTPVSPEADAVLRKSYPRRPVEGGPVEQILRDGEIAQITDIEAGSHDPWMRANAQARGWRSLLQVPLRADSGVIGWISISRKEAGSFAEKDVELLQTFADQAVIAIQNVELFEEVQARTRDLQESLQQQTATSEVLEVISSSMGDVQPVFEKMLESAAKVCGAQFGAMGLYAGEAYRRVAVYNVPPAFDVAAPREFSPASEGPIGRVLRTGQVVRIDDLRQSPVYLARNPVMVAMVELAEARSLVVVPLLKDAKPIGQISIYRKEIRPFSDKEVDLLKNFANQAVIAIENARLFNETKEALERQTATADILKVIATSPDDVQPVFQAIADRSNRLVNALSTTVFRLVDGMMYLRAFTPVTPEADAKLQATFPAPLSTFSWSELISKGEIYRVIDAEQEAQGLRDLAHERGWRSCLCVPLIRDGKPIGMIGPTRAEPGPFTDHHVQLMQTFADQAVIAIQNVELFEEVQRRTRDLQESLQQQTATADVLKVISRSAFDLQTVLNTLVEFAARLCEADECIILQPKGDGYGLSADWGLPPEKKEFLASVTFRPADGRLVGRVLQTGKIAHIHDVLAEPGFVVAGDPDPARTRLGVPLLRDGIPVGVFVLTRLSVRPFTERQIELVQTYAAQAVIAIENARLFNETREALERQTASADILKVIAGSPDDVQPVFDAIAERSNRLVNGLSTAVYSLVGDMVHLRSFTPVNATADAALQATFPARLSELRWWHEEPGLDEVFFVEDAEVAFEKRTSSLNLARFRGWRSWMRVPLLSDGRAIGFITVTRVEPGRFDDHHVQMLKTFADQAVIAISNVELFQEVQQRTRELSQSLDDLRMAQDRLVQTEKLASLGQLTAGIAHEIKNPLNFVNNFSALSVELTDELNDVLRQAEVAGKVRQEVGELTQLLKSNLDKVVQHGKRADSIVRNMLLHSREGSGERRSVDINALVEESLNLAYHGARAERSDFQIALERDLDPGAGHIELYPQEITRALLNMISNGFYAATKRAGEAGNGFEPTLLAATRGLADRVEIRIRDNGTGIPSEVKEKMFNPFFTTKPAGEGTGLGLSMSHDIVVKQHGGTIDVETEAGRFTEFIIVLPRTKQLRQEA